MKIQHLRNDCYHQETDDNSLFPCIPMQIHHR